MKVTTFIPNIRNLKYNINQQNAPFLNWYFNLRCLLHGSKPRVHLQEDNCMYRYGIVCFTCWNYNKKNQELTKGYSVMFQKTWILKTHIKTVYFVSILFRSFYWYVCSQSDLTHCNESNLSENWSVSVGSDHSLTRIFVFKLGTSYLWLSIWPRMRKSLLFAWSYLY